MIQKRLDPDLTTIMRRWKKSKSGSGSKNGKNQDRWLKNGKKNHDRGRKMVKIRIGVETAALWPRDFWRSSATAAASTLTVLGWKAFLDHLQDRKTLLWSKWSQMNECRTGPRNKKILHLPQTNIIKKSYKTRSNQNIFLSIYTF